MTTSRPTVTVVAECVQEVVVVSAKHPSLGALYWAINDGSDHNAPTSYTITNRIEDALRLRKGWREGIMGWQYRDHMAKVMADDSQFEQFHDLDETLDGSWATTTHLYGMLDLLQHKSGQDVEAFAQWLETAAWRDEVTLARPLDISATYVVPQLQMEAVSRPFQL